MLNFVFLEKDLGIVSPPNYVKDFSRKMFLMLDSINWLNVTAWLPIILEILVNMCIPGCDIMNFEIKLISLIKPFFCMTKKSKLKI